jgi:hypothetical protein
MTHTSTCCSSLFLRNSPSALLHRPSIEYINPTICTLSSIHVLHVVFSNTAPYSIDKSHSCGCCKAAGKVPDTATSSHTFWRRTPRSDPMYTAAAVSPAHCPLPAIVMLRASCTKLCILKVVLTSEFRLENMTHINTCSLQLSMIPSLKKALFQN